MYPVFLSFRVRIFGRAFFDVIFYQDRHIHVLKNGGKCVSMNKEEILQILPERIRRIAAETVTDWKLLQEIHIRIGGSIVLVIKGEKIMPAQGGQVVGTREFREIMEYISNYSMYAFEEEIQKGYLTIPGGHRVGVAGKALMEQGQVRTIRHITFLNIRVSHEIPGCADRVMPYLFERDRFLPTLIVSPPGAGKTTLLRDIVRQTATGGKMFSAKKVSVIDERSEIAGCYQGIPQRDVGVHCDVLDGCHKQEGIYMMLRSMAPEVIAVDEIGAEKDYEALNTALTSGCSLLATVHGNSFQHIREKPQMRKILEERMFERILFLQSGEPGKGIAIYDGRGQVVSR